MITTEGYFENIKGEILLELQHAKKQIYIAVAWFTDKELFNVLLNKPDSVKVEILVTEDEINNEVGILSWTIPSNIKIFTVSERLMHHKFCVIDGKTVITGSFNWTKKASTENDENITIIKGDFELAQNYINEFIILTNQKIDTNVIEIGKIVKRLKIIIDMIELQEIEDIDLQVQRLSKENQLEVINDIINTLNNKNWTEAIVKIQNFINSYSRLIKYEDPFIKALQMEIKQFEYELIAVENECDDSYRIIAKFNSLFFRTLGQYIKEIIKLKSDYHHSHRQESQYSESEYQKAKTEYEQFANERKRVESQKNYDLSDLEVKDLKVLYKEAVHLCHPDKNPGKEADAHEIFTKLQDVYQRQDIFSLRDLLSQVKAGWLKREIEILFDKDILTRRHSYLNTKVKNKLEELTSLTKSEEYLMGKKSNKEIQDYFIVKQLELEKEKDYWVSLLKNA